MRKLLLLLILALAGGCACAQLPADVAPAMIYTDADGMLVEDDTQYSGDAPFTARFESRVTNLDSGYALYEWQFLRDGDSQPFLTRYDADTEYTFVQSGTFYVTLYITFVVNGDSLEWEVDEPFVVNISESKLEVPNAFTPNGDGINDTFHVKEGYTSIVDFHAAIFTRSGKKVYEWTDPAGGWDGTMNGSGGHPAPDGGYYLVLDARGADGLEYHYKKTISLLRTYNERTSGTTTTP